MTVKGYLKSCYNEREVSMIGELFKLVGTMINGATNVMAGTAILASAGIMAAQNNAENKKKRRNLKLPD